jgi:flagellar basal-body rod modification protein FlgD
MSVDATSDASSTTNQTNTTSALTKKALGQDAFLQLLVTQLQHQDPTKPVDDSQFITQLAQFSSLEKLTQIADNTEALSSAFEALQDTATSGTTNS